MFFYALGVPYATIQENNWMDAVALVFAHTHNVCLSLLRFEIFCGMPQSARVQIWLQLAILALPVSWSARVEI